MATVREQLQQLQKRGKRARIPTADDSIIEENVEDHVEEDLATSDNEENNPPVQLKAGTTICAYGTAVRLY